jgi:hypothetical protein
MTALRMKVSDLALTSSKLLRYQGVDVCTESSTSSGNSSLQKLGVLSSIFASISALCHTTKLDVEMKWLRGKSMLSSLSLRLLSRFERETPCSEEDFS